MLTIENCHRESGEDLGLAQPWTQGNFQVKASSVADAVAEILVMKGERENLCWVTWWTRVVEGIEGVGVCGKDRSTGAHRVAMVALFAAGPRGLLWWRLSSWLVLPLCADKHWGRPVRRYWREGSIFDLAIPDTSRYISDALLQVNLRLLSLSSSYLVFYIEAMWW